MRTISIFALVFAVAVSLFGTEPRTIVVWPNGVPGSLRDPNYKEQTTFWNNDRSWPIVKYVSQPTLEIFPAEPSRSKGAAIVICPGGGYVSINIEKEGREVARWLSGIGVTAIVLKYRLPSPAIMKEAAIGPLQDVQESIRIVRRSAAAWQIDPQRIGVMGFSSGGHLAATASTLYSEKTYESADRTSARPNFSVLVYPLISMRPELTAQGLRHDLLGNKPNPARVELLSAERHVTKETPTTFIVHSRGDQAVPVAQSIHYADALKAQGVPVELHLYDKGNHAYGIGVLPDWPASWPDDLKTWLTKSGLL